ncbi:hypothetical protein COCVIDRAFT_20286 [Bipolaris victoriae FI3]|uniref:Uncharacterized protein n=1 Tax=Bipolaris victoriae (strain FI3) TaxID=930091 RepID=W7E409_BIPV3|nr:hypothetical protein COCVIDRAFT_20286 [Bipolaris victoriae FI3]
MPVSTKKALQRMLAAPRRYKSSTTEKANVFARRQCSVRHELQFIEIGQRPQSKKTNWETSLSTEIQLKKLDKSAVRGTVGIRALPARVAASVNAATRSLATSVGAIITSSEVEESGAGSSKGSEDGKKSDGELHFEMEVDWRVR